MRSTNVLRYGSDEPLPEQIPLRAGRLTMVFEGGDLRYIRLGDREILRRVYAAVRDPNWGTVPPRLSNLELHVEDESFRITYDVEHRDDPIDFHWRGTITGDWNGTVTFRMEGAAHSTFLRNRIGCCVLHPMRECAGQPCVIEHADGTTEHGRFPDRIAPAHPFLEIAAITHTVLPGLYAEVRFAGDIFEMEDQRNWTDASYKTYCTPLRLPFPAEIRSGTRVAQSVTLTLQGELSVCDFQAETEPVSIAVGSQPVAALPRLGLGVASDGQPLSAEELARLRALNLHHLRVDLRLSDPGYSARLEQAADEARALGVALEVALLVSDAAEDELAALVAVLDRVRPPVYAWLIFRANELTTDERTARLARAALAAYDSQALVAGGANAYFTELNRGGVPVAALDVVAYSINPQVHAFDNASLVETLEAQAATARSARQLASGRPLHISPVTLRPRFNAVATGPEPEPTPGELPWSVDPRQMSLFGAAWTAGSLKYLAEAGVASITYYETAGWRGVMERVEGAPLPARFPSVLSSVFPLYHVLAAAGAFAGGEVLPLASSDTLRVDGIALRRANISRIVLANMHNEQQEVRVPIAVDSVHVRVLDETNVVQAMMDPECFRAREGDVARVTGRVLRLSLRPYAVACLDMDIPTQVEE